MQQRINKILSRISNKYQMTEKEYRYILDLSLDKTMLVFGCGKDSDLWRLICKKVLFLEHNKKWIDTKNNDTIHISYSSTMRNTDILLKEFQQNNYDNLYIESLKNNELVINESWNSILVDAPEGYDINNHHGRIQSIFMAKYLANSNTNIFIHDINRSIEKMCYETFGFKKINEFDRLIHCIL